MQAPGGPKDEGGAALGTARSQGALPCYYAAMRGFRLNGWQRIGVVGSILWAMAGGLWGNHLAIQKGGAIPIAHYKACVSQPDYDDDECSAAFDEEYTVGVRGHLAFAAMVALIPIVVSWPLVYIVVYLGERDWQR